MRVTASDPLLKLIGKILGSAVIALAAGTLVKKVTNVTEKPKKTESVSS